MVKASTPRAADLASIPALPGGALSGSSYTIILKLRTPVASLPGVLSGSSYTIVLKLRTPVASLPGVLSGSSYTIVLKLRTPVASLPGDKTSALELVGPVSVYCDWVT